MNLNRLINTLSIQTASYDTDRMSRFVKKQLSSRGISYTTDSYGNIYATKGNAKLYPTMVCHIDTVHDVNDNVIVKRQGDYLYAIDTKKMTQYGIGGDDKVGVYITLELLDVFQHFKAVFFLDEEVGCIGSSMADTKFFNDSTIILQCDRRGSLDFTDTICNTQMLSDEFKRHVRPIVEQYGRVYANGGLTDVYELSDDVPICMANMSCGYYNPHTNQEYVSISDVSDTLQFCKQIFISTAHKQWSIQRPKSIPYSYTPSTYGRIGNTSKHRSYKRQHIDDYDPYIIDESQTCQQCGELLLYDYEANQHFCIECNNYVSTSKNTNHDRYSLF